MENKNTNKELYFICPYCGHWNSVKPIDSVELPLDTNAYVGCCQNHGGMFMVDYKKLEIETTITYVYRGIKLDEANCDR